jgi:aldehyde dehydrogenase (NAD+)
MTVTQGPKLFIDGDWVSASESITIISPTTGEPLVDVGVGTPEDVDAAVRAAKAAYTSGAWADLDADGRATLLERLADELTDRAEEISVAVSTQNGMPIAMARQLEGAYPPMVYRYYAQLVREEPAVRQRDGLLGGQIDITYDSLGVVAAITPSNFPQTLGSLKIAAALAAGNTVVLKPPVATVLDSLIFAEAVRAAGLPAGVVNVVPGGAEVAVPLVAHPDVSKVAFTGSTAVGRQIAKTCGELLRPVTLELGGKSAAIVLDDADLEMFAQNLVGVSLLNNGQTCFACTRILVPSSRFEEILDLITQVVGSLPIGDPLEDSTAIGPLVSERARDSVESAIADAIKDGARVAVGGGRPADRPAGWFLNPTVLVGIDNSAEIAQREVFGPVLVVLPYTDDDDAVRIANDSSYGLGGTVWTTNPQRGDRVASQISSGTVGINGYLPDPVAPFGGVRNSGLGRELGPEGLAEYRVAKSIYHPAPAPRREA